MFMISHTCIWWYRVFSISSWGSNPVNCATLKMLIYSKFKISFTQPAIVSIKHQSISVCLVILNTMSIFLGHQMLNTCFVLDLCPINWSKSKSLLHSHIFYKMYLTCAFSSSIVITINIPRVGYTYQHDESTTTIIIISFMFISSVVNLTFSAHYTNCKKKKHCSYLASRKMSLRSRLALNMNMLLNILISVIALGGREWPTVTMPTFCK